MQCPATTISDAMARCPATIILLTSTIILPTSAVHAMPYIVNTIAAPVMLTLPNASCRHAGALSCLSLLYLVWNADLSIETRPQNFKASGTARPSYRHLPL